MCDVWTPDIKGPIPTFDVNEFQVGMGPSGHQTSPQKTLIYKSLLSQIRRRWQRESQRVKQIDKKETIHESQLTVLTVTRKGVAAVDVASMVGVVLSEELPGMLRRRPVLSGGDSAKKRERSLKCGEKYMLKE